MYITHWIVYTILGQHSRQFPYFWPVIPYLRLVFHNSLPWPTEVCLIPTVIQRQGNAVSEHTHAWLQWFALPGRHMNNMVSGPASQVRLINMGSVLAVFLRCWVYSMLCKAGCWVSHKAFYFLISWMLSFLFWYSQSALILNHWSVNAFRKWGLLN